jgi:hypothetical protein
MRFARTHLGLIPDYQFSSDPAVNFTKINPFVQYPPGVYQSTIQPIGPYFQTQPPASGMNGIFDSWAWTNRQWLAFGIVSILGIGAAAGLTSILR